MSDLNVTVGLLFSTTGSYRIIGRSQIRGAILAMEEVSADPALPIRLTPAIADPGGIAQRYASVARDLLAKEKLTHVVGCYTSASRKEVVPLFEKHDALLWYPSHYEGFETCGNVVYTGAAPNQHIVPLIDFILANMGRRAWMVGSNYVWAWECHRIMREALQQAGGEVLGERYLPIGETDLQDVVERICDARPAFVFNNLIGESAYTFFRLFRQEAQRRGIDQPRDMPVLSCTLSEVELDEIGADAADGHVTSSVYFQSLARPANHRFVEAWRRRFPDGGPTSADAEAVYIAVHLLGRALAAAGDESLEAVREVLDSVALDAPQGAVRIDGGNRHCFLTPRIARSRRDGAFDVLYEAPEPVRPDPYLAWQKPWSRPDDLQAPLLRIVS